MAAPAPRRLALAILALYLAGCGERGGTSVPRAEVVPEAGSGRIEWRAELACADCEAIDTRLVLQREGDSRGYVLTETYLAENGGTRFVERGRWEREAALLRLRGDGGGERVFALLPDGRLEPRDGHGRRLAPREGDFLLPVSGEAP